MAPDQESRVAPVDQHIEDLCNADLNVDLGGPVNNHVPEDDSSGTDSIPDIDLALHSDVHLEWSQVHRVGAGLANLGNTCFLNTVMQCLTYCPPLANYLLQNDHCSTCQSYEFCMMCELQRHVREALERSGDVIEPIHIYENIKLIAEHFQSGQQEDAHEFLRFVIENLSANTSINNETTIVNNIFGGYNRSQVVCLKCKKMSNTYEHCMDLILDIKQNANSLERALEQYVKPEILEEDNAYKCPGCNVLVSAQKTNTIHRPPNVATIQLKRFDYNKSNGGKITKYVSYPDFLDLSPFMSEKVDMPIMYRLNAVLVHTGQNCNSGHYYCYIRNSNENWYLMDDAKVQRVGLKDVLGQQAYLLFYVRAPMFDPIQKRANGLVNGHGLKNGKPDKFSTERMSMWQKWGSRRRYRSGNNRRPPSNSGRNSEEDNGHSRGSSESDVTNGDGRMNGCHNSPEGNHNGSYEHSHYSYSENGPETNGDYPDDRFSNRGNFYDRNRQYRDYSRSRNSWNGNYRRQADEDKGNGKVNGYEPQHRNGLNQYNGHSNSSKFYRSNSDSNLQSEMCHAKGDDESIKAHNAPEGRWVFNRPNSDKGWRREDSRSPYRNETGYPNHWNGGNRWRNSNGFRSKQNYYNADSRYNFDQERNGYRKFHLKSKSADFFPRPRNNYPYYNPRRQGHLQECF